MFLKLQLQKISDYALHRGIAHGSVFMYGIRSLHHNIPDTRRHALETWETGTRNLRKFLSSNLHSGSCKFFYKLRSISARNVYKKSEEKLAQLLIARQTSVTCKFLVQIDLNKFLECVYKGRD